MRPDARLDWTRPIIWMLLSCALVLQIGSLWSVFERHTQHSCHVSSVSTPTESHTIDATHHCLMWCMGTAAHAPVRIILPLLIVLDRVEFKAIEQALVAWQTAPPIRPPISS
jgi:hypothetical protein